MKTEAATLIQSWCQGRAQLDQNNRLVFKSRQASNLTEKCRLAYQWILDNAIYCPYSDIEYGTSIILGRAEQQIKLATEDSYASFILLPLLTLMISRRLLLIGAPGRGKTTVATLMALLAGYSLDDIKHAIQHGHPQMTQADILGSPLPSDLVQARESADIRVLWRQWIRMRVKIIDEYNALRHVCQVYFKVDSNLSFTQIISAVKIVISSCVTQGKEMPIHPHAPQLFSWDGYSVENDLTSPASKQFFSVVP